METVVRNRFEDGESADALFEAIPEPLISEFRALNSVEVGSDGFLRQVGLGVTTQETK